MTGHAAGSPASVPGGRSAERSLRLLLAATLVLPALLLGGLAWQLHGSHFAQAHAKLERKLDLLLEHAVKVFETHELAAGQVDQILYGLTDSEIRASERELHGRLAAVVRTLEQVQDVWVLDRDGRPLVGANVYPYPAELDLSDREYFRVHRDGRLPPRTAYVSEVLRGRAVDGSPMQLFSARRGARGPDSPTGFTGVTAIAVNLRYFERFYAKVAADGRAADGLGSIALIRADGAVLVRYPSVAGVPVQARARGGLLDAIAAAPEQGAYQNASAIDGAVRLVAYRHLPGYPLYVTAGLDRSTIVQGWLRDLATYLAVALPAVAGLFLLALLALRRTRGAAEAAARLREEVARREEAEQRLVQAQRMEAVGQLTAGIAHDFNNLLQAQMAGLDLLLDEVRGQERAQALIERALAAGSRGAKLTHHLLAFSRKQALQPQIVDLPELLADLAHVLARTLGPKVELAATVAPGVASPYADAVQLESALLNLCLNARDAMPGGGRLRIEADEADEADAGTADVPDGLGGGRYVRIAVTDTGTGMDPATLARACEPFFTTKEVGKGSGLGLSMVQGFVRQSGGELRIRSKPGEGTRIELWLPCAFTAAAALAESRQAEREGERGEGRVLLVDDAPDVLALVGEMLEGAGFEVVPAEGGEAALARLQEAAGAFDPSKAGASDVSKATAFDVLVTDYAMPRMDGAALVRRARQVSPGLPAVVITGYADRPDELGRLPDVRIVHKPFRADALAREVCGAMRRGAGRASPAAEQAPGGTVPARVASAA